MTRNIDDWHASVMKTVHWRARDPWLRIASYVDWGAALYYPMLTKLFATFFQGDFPSRGKEVFRNYYDEVRRLVPRENILEYHISQGWDPLCEFLGAPKPVVAFPRLNDTEAFVRRCQIRNARQICNGLFRYFLLLLSIKLLLFVLMSLG